MCVDTTTEIYTDRIKRRERPFRAYKVLRSPTCRGPVFKRGTYGPGKCESKTRYTYYEYKGGRCYGLHICRSKRAARYWLGNKRLRLIPVTIHPEDVIAADRNEIAVRCLYISKRDWVVAGMPNRKERLRVI